MAVPQQRDGNDCNLPADPDGTRGVIEVGLIDDHSMYREGAALWLNEAAGGAVRVVATAATVEQFLAGVGEVGVVLLDLRLADESDPLTNIATLLDAGHRVLVHSSTESPDAVRAVVQAGALGYVAKSAPLSELMAAIGAAAMGEAFFTRGLAYGLLQAPPRERPNLSSREIEVLRGIAAGRTRAAVAYSLGITEGTVKTYLERLRRKYREIGRDADGLVDLYQRASEDGLLL